MCRFLLENSWAVYNPTFKGYHFWGLSITGVMKSDNISNAVTSTEEIEVGYYSNSKVVLKNQDTGVVKAAYASSDTPGHE